MPSPFPGMDPFLEDPPRWAGVHSGVIAQICAFLNERLPPGYAADIGERVWVVRPERAIYPDVALVEAPSGGRAGERAALVADPPWIISVEGAEMREPFVEIRPIDDSGKLVTAIEVLSPSNKAEDSEGRELYLRKQREVLASPTHLLEIDLLRHGSHTVAAPRTRLAGKERWDYVVCLHRGDVGARFAVWAFSLRERLPRVLVPLLERDPDLVLDLQEIFDRAYDAGPYRRRVDYTREPPLPVTYDDAAWMQALLADAGLRPA